ncbi:MAG: hypothetical protein QW051_01055 [Candidatus Aenigmatarchaeota archaeon]
MEHSKKVGIAFGTTSAVITTLGLMVGLHSGTHSKLAVLGGIITIAIADAFSDALGVHISEESEGIHSKKELWSSFTYTFLSKFLIAFTFIFPILYFSLETAMIINVFWGLILLSILSFRIGGKNKKALEVVAEHLIIALIVVIFSHFLGDLIYFYFGVENLA